MVFPRPHSIHRGARWAPFVFFGLWALMGCSNDEQAVSALRQQFTGAMIEQHNVQIVYSDSGMAKIRVTTGVWEDYSSDDEQPRQVFRQGFRVEILDQQGRVTGHLKAQKAVRRMSDQVWVLTGDVEVVQEGGNALYTDAMEWDRVNQVFRSESKVRIIDKGEEVQGKGFEAKEDLSQYTIFAVSGHFEGQD
ncbi:MAG: LPS export ABC transporter periplasmic protein LptC [Flavobacteriia bacterium]|nr:LPS export ABC transporter periplasmic protein LptC [Flavobacteriia bacterium]